MIIEPHQRQEESGSSGCMTLMAIVRTFQKILCKADNVECGPDWLDDAFYASKSATTIHRSASESQKLHKVQSNIREGP